MSTASVAVVALVTCPQDRADDIARALVEARVAACVNVVPAITSTYRWKDEVCRDDEALLIIKTLRERFDDLRREVLRIHPYELPEVILLPVAAGHAPYLDWIAANTSVP
jgi:periplasmic divalent cation tolerance protein